MQACREASIPHLYHVAQRGYGLRPGACLEATVRIDPDTTDGETRTNKRPARRHTHNSHRHPSCETRHADYSPCCLKAHVPQCVWVMGDGWFKQVRTGLWAWGCVCVCVTLRLPQFVLYELHRGHDRRVYVIHPRTQVPRVPRTTQCQHHLIATA